MKTRLTVLHLRHRTNNYVHSYRSSKKRDFKFYYKYILTCKWYQKLKRNQIRLKKNRQRQLYRCNLGITELDEINYNKNHNNMSCRRKHSKLNVKDTIYKSNNVCNNLNHLNYPTILYSTTMTQNTLETLLTNKTERKSKSNLSLVRCVSLHNLRGNRDNQKLILETTSHAPTNPVSSSSTESTIHKVLANIFFCCVKKKQNKGARATLVDDGKHKQPVMDLFKRTTNDFSCQYDLKSNQSIEITSHMLSKPTSQTSSIRSIFKSRNLLKPKRKSCSVFQVMIYTLGKKMKSKPSKTLAKSRRNNVVILPVPRKFTTSTTNPLSTTYNNTKLIVSEKPLLARIKSTKMENANCVIKSKDMDSWQKYL